MVHSVRTYIFTDTTIYTFKKGVFSRRLNRAFISGSLGKTITTINGVTYERNNLILEPKYTVEKQTLAKQIIDLEKAALDRWFKGDTSGYKELWSKHSFSYFDAVVDKRVDDYVTIAKFLDSIEGKLFADSYDFRHPRVQLGQDMAVLTFQLFAKTNLLDMEYNCIEVFQKEMDGTYRVIHSTWSFIRPMDKNFDKKNIV